VHEQAYDVDAMYDPSGRYRYNKYGTNWRAVVAWFVAWIPLTPGFASGVGFLSGAWKLSWILTLTTAKVTPSLKDCHRREASCRPWLLVRFLCERWGVHTPQSSFRCEANDRED
jgi:hypothetical protein